MGNMESDFKIIDDLPFNNDDADWFSRNFKERIQSGESIIIICSRLHEEGELGELL